MGPKLDKLSPIVKIALSGSWSNVTLVLSSSRRMVWAYLNQGLPLFSSTLSLVLSLTTVTEHGSSHCHVNKERWFYYPNNVQAILTTCTIPYYFWAIVICLKHSMAKLLIFPVFWVIKCSLGHYVPVAKNSSVVAVCHWLIKLQTYADGRSALLRQCKAME